jgi:hypothetical protein
MLCKAFVDALRRRHEEVEELAGTAGAFSGAADCWHPCQLVAATVSDKPIDLDQRRGVVSQHATDLRRLTAETAASQAALQQRQQALERYLEALPARSWQEAADKARYLLSLLEATSGDARVRSMIVAVLADFDRLLQRDL